jgi:hypothetical protein
MKSMTNVIVAALVAVFSAGTVLAAEPSEPLAAAAKSVRSPSAPTAGRHFRLNRKPKKVVKRTLTRPDPRARNSVR